MNKLFQRVGLPFVMSLLLCSHAYAGLGVERRSVVVNIAGIDLRTEAGRGLVYRKLKRAAKQACIDVESRHNLNRSTLYSQCVHDALTAAVAQVRYPVSPVDSAQHLEVREPAVASVSRAAD